MPETAAPTIETARAAAGTVLGTGLVTGGLTVDYPPAGRGRLDAQATVVRAGAGAAVLTCEVRVTGPTGVGTVCAIGQGRVTRRRPGR